MLLTRQQAAELFEKVITERNASEFPFEGTMEQTFREHCTAVAHIAECIAATCPDLDTEKAYILGLLHDTGRVMDEPRTNTFHGMVGYHYLMKLRLDDIAKISITHCFCFKDFDISSYPQNREQLLEAKELLKSMEYDDYDLLIQLSDLMNDKGKTCRIEERYGNIAKRYQIPSEKIEPLINKLNEIKSYFEGSCGQDIYSLLHIQEKI